MGTYRSHRGDRICTCDLICLGAASGALSGKIRPLKEAGGNQENMLK
jgi:hypothetical protein